MALVSLLNLLPAAQAFLVSLQHQDVAGRTSWIGWANYAAALGRGDPFGPSLAHTIQYTAGSVAGAYLVGLALALLLSADVRCRALLRALFLVPWVIPDVATTMLWKWLYGDQFGILNTLLLRARLIGEPIQFLADPDLAMASVIAVQVWKLYPIMFVTLLAALGNVPPELYEAARLDGAGRARLFWHVTLPLIRPASVVISLLGAIWTFQSFDIVYLLTGGGPADATRVLSTLIYDKAFYATDRGYASAAATLMLAVLMALTVLYLLAYRRDRES